MSDELMELPDGWEWVKTGDVCEGVVPGRTKPKNFNGTIPWITLPDITGMYISASKSNLAVTKEDAEEVGMRVMPKGTVLMSCVGQFGLICIAETDVVPNQQLHGFICLDEVLPEYVAYALTTQVEQMNQLASATTIAYINKTKCNSIQIPLAPLSEQRRIVAKIEELRERSQRAREALTVIPELCDRFRQSVLAAAFRGDLTADWREQNPDVEPASVLLERIRRDRRYYWEEEEVAKMQLKGKLPKDEKWKLKYRKPIEPITSDLPELPQGWSWASWDQISNWVTYGFTRPMPHVDEGIPIVTAKHVLDRRIDTKSTHKTTVEAFNELSDKDRPKPGDILITKDGTLGRAAIVTQENQFCINQSVAVVWLRSCPINRRYLLAVIESPLSQKPILEKARGNAIQHLSITDFARMVLPVPPIQEQEMIVEQLDSAFAVIEEVQAIATKNLLENNQLDRSILAKAFRGELVEQDPTDEPAAVLLERIRAEREQVQGKAKKPGKRGQRTIKADPP